MKSILFVSYCFPPLQVPESILSSRCAKYLARCDWNPHIITVDPRTSYGEPRDDTMQHLVPSDVPVHRVPSFEPRLGIIAAYRLAPLLVKSPDAKVGWQRPALSYIRNLMRKQRFDVMQTWSMYLTDHMIGLKLKKESGLPWVAHFSDPWTDNPYRRFGRIEKSINLKMERDVMQAADAIVFVSEETRRMVMGRFSPDIARKSLVIPHSYDTELCQMADRQPNSKFTLTFTGNFYGPRTPLTLFTALQQMQSQTPDLSERLNIRIVGKLPPKYSDAVMSKGIDKLVTAVGHVPYVDSLVEIRNADVLIVIDAASDSPSIFLPVKLIEYAAALKPILGITPVEGASATLIRRLGGIVVSPDDTMGIGNAIAALMQEYRSGTLDKRRYSFSDIKEYDPMVTARALSDVFDRVKR